MAKAKTDTVEKAGGFRFRYVFLIIILTLLVLSVFSHSPDDLAILEGGKEGTLHNWIGPVGAHTARALFYLFGIAVYPITFLLIICIIRPFLPFPTHRKGYIGALLAILLGATILFAMWPADFAHRTEMLGIGHNDAPLSALSGGVIGQQLAAPKTPEVSAGLIRGFIGTIGTLIVALTFLLTGAFFVWLADWKVICLHFLKKEPKTSDQRLTPSRKTKDDKDKDEDEKDKSEEDEDDAGSRLSDLREKRAEMAQMEATSPEPEEDEEEEEEPPPRRTSPPPKPAAPAPTRSSAPKDIAAPNYVLPPLSLLERGKETKGESSSFVEESKHILQATLESFNVDGQVTGIITGPRVTRYEISLAPGVKVEKVVSIQNNIAMELQAESIRVLAPIPGRNAVGIEAPNSSPSAVYLRSLMESPQWQESKADVPIILGKDVAGKPIILDLAKAPHLLIAGATGSGKSVCMNTLVMSLLFRFSPAELRLIMVDPKVVELKVYTPLPHLITPVVNDAKKVPLALRWAVNEMERRYLVLAKVGAKNLNGFNERPPDPEPMYDQDGNLIPPTLPLLVVIVDELADVMMTDAKSDVETSIARIAQKGRAAGIHIVIATQTPRKDIITGVIKANLPTRIAFRVTSIIDSRVILDQKGAESLLGKGDMLFIPPGSANMDRIQGAMVSDPDIKKVVDFVSDQAEQEFNKAVVSEKSEEAESSGDDTIGPDEVDPLVAKYLEPGDNDLIKQALDIILRERKASTSYLQRRLKIGYNRAAEIIDDLEQRGIVSPPLPGGSKRDILILDQIEDE